MSEQTQPAFEPYGDYPQREWYEQALTDDERDINTVRNGQTAWKSRMSDVIGPAPDEQVPGLTEEQQAIYVEYGMGRAIPWYQARTDKTAGGQPEDPDNPPQVEQRQIVNLAFEKAPLPMKANTGDSKFTKEDISSANIAREAPAKYHQELNGRNCYVEKPFPTGQPSFFANNEALKTTSRWILKADGRLILRSDGVQALSQVANEG